MGDNSRNKRNFEGNCGLFWEIAAEDFRDVGLIIHDAVSPIANFCQVIPPSTYTYRLFLIDKILLCARGGVPVVSGKTLVTSSLNDNLRNPRVVTLEREYVIFDSREQCCSCEKLARI